MGTLQTSRIVYRLAVSISDMLHQRAVLHNVSLILYESATTHAVPLLDTCVSGYA